jgi:hypothetical protein
VSQVQILSPRPLILLSFSQTNPKLVHVCAPVLVQHLVHLFIRTIDASPPVRRARRNPTDVEVRTAHRPARIKVWVGDDSALSESTAQWRSLKEQLISCRDPGLEKRRGDSATPYSQQLPEQSECRFEARL